MIEIVAPRRTTRAMIPALLAGAAKRASATLAEEASA
jgi:hypothetical protein